MSSRVGRLTGGGLAGAWEHGNQCCGREALKSNACIRLMSSRACQALVQHQVSRLSGVGSKD